MRGSKGAYLLIRGKDKVKTKEWLLMKEEVSDEKEQRSVYKLVLHAKTKGTLSYGFISRKSSL